jgi:hypothetical protein
MKSISFLSIFFTILLVNSAHRQIPSTTESGDRVILNNDGTWKYSDSNKNNPEIRQRKNQQITRDGIIVTLLNAEIIKPVYEDKVAGVRIKVKNTSNRTVTTLQTQLKNHCQILWFNCF